MVEIVVVESRRSVGRIKVIIGRKRVPDVEILALA